MELRQGQPARDRLVQGDRQFFKTLAGAIATQIKGDGCGLRQFAEAMFGGNLPQCRRLRADHCLLP